MVAIVAVLLKAICQLVVCDKIMVPTSSHSDRIWFWVKDPTDDHKSNFNWSRDNIYGAAVLLGAGSATCLVMSLSYISYAVGEYTVSHKPS